jgi:hypothetical protein
VSCYGCKKLVEIDPPQKSIDNTGEFGSDAQAETAMAGLYSQMMTNTGALVYSNGGTTIAAGLSSDELVVTQGAQAIYDYQFQRNRLQVSNMTVQNIWTNIYQNTYTANSIIENLPGAKGVTDSTKNELLGEAKFIRAFGYFYLVNFFGDVPLVLTTDFTKTAKLPKTPQADVYKQIVSDLLDAQSRLPSGYAISAGQRIIPNKLAATALLARVYLYQKDWKDAALQASSVINNSQLSLNNDITTVFLKGSPETIWQLQLDTKVVNADVNMQEVKAFRPTLVFSDLSPGDQALYLDPSIYPSIAPYIIPPYTLRPEMVSAFEPNDQRAATWTGYAGSPNVAPYNGVTTYFPSKYKFYASAGVDPQEFYVVLRLAEQYLIRAEAEAELGDIADAAIDINKIRTRAGLPNTTANSQATMIDAVMHERQVEFFAEWGHRWFDLKRTGQAVKVLGTIADKNPFAKSALLYPIPQSEIINDPFITQNQGY